MALSVVFVVDLPLLSHSPMVRMFMDGKRLSHAQFDVLVSAATLSVMFARRAFKSLLTVQVT